MLTLLEKKDTQFQRLKRGEGGQVDNCWSSSLVKKKLVDAKGFISAH